MRIRRLACTGCGSWLLVLLTCGAGYAQFTGNIRGSVIDASGAGIANATIEAVNAATRVSATTTSDASGSYQFLSLAPGSYTLTAEAKGFRKAEANVTLQTSQTLNVPLSLEVGAVSEQVTVSAETPLVNTAETRNQLTLQSDSLSSLPLAGRSFISLVTLAPGVSGLGTMGGGQPGGAGTPGSGVDNYSTETAVDVSANGQGTVANQFIIDGLNVTSGIRQGVLNLTPNPDAIQETSIQVNTFSVEYGGGSSIQMVSTTKSGADQFHGLVSDYFNYEKMFAKTVFMGPNDQYNPFHSNNFSGTVGGPIVPRRRFFFFFAAEPLRSSASTGNQTIFFPDRQFATWAQQNYPNTFGTRLLNTYLPSGASTSGVSRTAADIFPGTCGTSATNGLPCSMPMIDTGIFNSSNFRNGDQYFVRLDKYLKADRIYGSAFRTVLHYGGPAVIPQFSTTSHNTEQAFQVNYAHVFSPTTLNEAIFAQNRIEGFIGETGDFTIPSISVTGLSPGYGVGFAQGDFIQHNYHWRDVLTHVRGAHVLKFGYEGWFGDDVEPFQGPWSQPKFSFDNLLTLAQDAPLTEAGVMYDPVTGQQKLWEWNAASRTWGAFAQDTWAARRNLTVTLGFRYDDQGNPYSRSDTTVFGNFYLGDGQSLEQRVANGSARATPHALNRSPTAYNPRVGMAWDVTGKGDWVMRSGFGLYANWLTQANVQEEFRGNPPGLILPTFFAGSPTPPVFVQGTGSAPPFGFRFPSLAGSPLCRTAPCLDAKGGIAGAAFPIGGINPNLKSPTAYIFAATLERRIGRILAASVLYSGSHSTNLVGNGNQAGLVSYGVDINEMPGDLLRKPPGAAPTRLNPSFGMVAYADNDRVANYNGVTFDLRGRAKPFFFDASYTRSSSKDDAGTGGTGYGLAYPRPVNPHQYYGPSPWDVPHRLSLTMNYELPAMNGGQGALGQLTGGWGVSAISILQSGYPFTVWTTAPFTAGGDYNADGDNLDYPNVSSYDMRRSQKDYLNGVFSPGQFTAPLPGTEGNEKTQQFRQPGFSETDLTAYKNAGLAGRLHLQLRFELYNVFNQHNLYLANNLAAGGFGKAISEQLPRWWQVGLKMSF
jgi:Carboxypeptidase regulatory-like domain